jgi:geranylgeranyl reductase family protein
MSSRDATGDVLIVGGGPAGALAALTLAGRGVHALVVDRKRFPRDKPCGGGIRAGVRSRFPEVLRHVAKHVELHELRRVHMESPSGASVVAASDVPFYLTLRRIELDTALLGHARDAGATVIESARVVDVTVDTDGVTARLVDGRELRARVVIGADGVNSVVARAVGLGDGFTDHTLAIDTMEETPLDELRVADPETMYVAYGYRGRPGYGYVFPKARHVDAGVGFLLAFFRTLEGAPWDHHAEFLAAAAAKGVVSGRSNRDNFKAYRLPLGGPLPRTYADRVLLAGDAGGFVNAYTGEGIYHAMVTGEHAGATAADALAAGDLSARALGSYETRWRAEIGAELADAVRIQRRLFADPSLADRVIRAAAVDARLCRLFAAVALGEEDLRRRRLEIAWRFALASLRLRWRRHRRAR